MRSVEAAHVPPFGRVSIDTGIAFETRVAIEYRQNLDVFPAADWIGRIVKPSAGYCRVDIAQTSSGRGKAIATGTVLGVVRVGICGHSKGKRHHPKVGPDQALEATLLTAPVEGA